jgi:DNA polymerase IV
VIDKGPFRLIGVGISNLEDLKTSENFGDLLDPEARKREKAERVSDKIREKFGDAAILKGRALR